ncbi:MAG: flagellar assembly protein FliW [Bacillota bacterium]
MLIQTRHFGEIEIQEDTILDFPEGIPGFEAFKKYAIIKNPDPENHFHWLQCVDNPEITFVVINPFLVMENYDFEIPEYIVEKLKIEDHGDILILSIVTIPENIEEMRTNLKAPVLININKKLGKQLVLSDDRYPMRYYFAREKAEG